MNRINKLPQPFKSRILFRCIEFVPLANLTQKNELFRKKLLDEYVQLDENITDNDLNIELQKINNCTGRDLEEFASALKRVYRIHDDVSDIMVIGRIHIDEVINKYLRTYSFAEYDKIEETEEERSERHYQGNLDNQNIHHQENMANHRESINSQNTHHEANIANQNVHYQGNLDNQNRLNLEGVKKQNEHFVQQILVQTASRGHDCATDLYLKFSTKNEQKLFEKEDLPASFPEKICLFLTDEQMEQFNNNMADTFQKRSDAKIAKKNSQKGWFGS